VTPADRLPTVPGLTGLTVLARGGYATVFRALQESVGRQVAVKVENRTLESERDRRRFLREARAAGRMSSHPHVVDLFDAGVTSSGHPYLIMELCRGTYAERMRATPLTPAEARDVGVKIADALADAHALGVLHRDVKPANLLITDFGEPALADFGLAILTEVRDISITLDVLTPAYAPPEMFRHSPPAPPADVYALCATLHALMAGKPPRWPNARDPSLVSLVDMFDQPIPDLPHVPRPLMALVRRGMSNVEAERPTAADLRDILMAMELGALPSQVLAPGQLPGPIPGPGPGSGPVESEEPTAVLGPGPGSGSGPGGGPGGLRPAYGPGHGPPGPAGSGWPAATPEPAGPLARLRGPWPPALLWSGAAAAFMLSVVAVVALALYLVPEPDPVRFVVRAPASSSATCPLNPPGTARCVTVAECFDRLTVSGGQATAPKVACAEPHIWEVFAHGPLPDALDNAGYNTIKQNAQVRQVCSVANARLLNAESAWQVDVLPPTRDQVRAGDRTYRCLAGRPPSKFTKSRFAR
jgi:tRNA A-37 threonylcarbamoyl transferase component Bud32